MVPNSFCVHEPDILTLNPKDLFQKIRQFGFRHMIIDRLSGKSGIRNLSQLVLSNKITEEHARKRILKERTSYWSNKKENPIIESYYGWYALLPIIRKYDNRHKIVVITRHPATWIKSNMDWGKFYGKEDYVNRLSSNRLNPEMIGDKANETAWEKFDQFEKLCWLWKVMNSALMEGSEKDENTLVLKFEDLFKGPNKATFLDQLLSHISTFSNKKYPVDLKKELLNEKIHTSIDSGFPTYENWNTDMKNTLQKHCGDLMLQLGYN